MSRTLSRALALLLAATALPALAQDAPPQFVAYDDVPFGSGDRALPLAVKLDPGDTSANIAIWVVYGDDAAEVRAATLTGQQPRGRVAITATSAEGVARARFVFPHSDNTTPNAQDVRAQKLSSGDRVFYKVVKARGTTLVESPVVAFIMPDKLTIANLGDSYASGEGAPYRTGAKWDNELCHRSGNSGQARAVATIIDENPETAIAFKNVACSGAQITEGLLLSQLRPSWIWEEVQTNLQTPVRPQLAVVRDWLADNGYAELNIAMVSGGGNDVDFGDFVRDYLVLPGIMGPDDEAGANLRRRIAQDVPQLYASLRQAFDANFTYDRVLVSEYADPMRGADGAYCDLPPFSPRSEFAALDAAFLRPLNAAIRGAVGDGPKWSMVATADRARGHGLCNDREPYFNNHLIASFAMQGDAYGIVHPTRTGHASTYRPAYEIALRDAVRDIRRKWAILAAKRSAREKAQAAATARAIAARTAIRPGAAGGALRVSVPAGLVNRPPLTAPAGDRAAITELLARARAEATGKSVPGDPLSDNRIADGRE
ncbi:GDSL-type esterase/lipase family protein [Sphingomonas sp. Leaf4]|uniref:GDSL-type esterase/lipase family protein n=1 Tax=Sphingomonas sp. Leaf4 TaxID=2876553 RepID=UPI001E3E637F|nr:GDSL-type esterase/lipase family protein [Sphingomonas sp. Leaf4]